MTPSKRLRRYLSLNVATTRRESLLVAVNKLTYAILRGAHLLTGTDLASHPLHWYRFPFDLRDRVLRSRSSSVMFVAGDAAGIQTMLFDTDYEPTGWLTFNRGDVFIDVGANIGQYTVSAARAVGPEGRVVAIEPDAKNRGYLVRNLGISRVANTIVVDVAAWSHRDTLPWHEDSVSVWHRVDRDGCGVVRSTSLDELITALNLERVDTIKIDVEGAELEVLQGATRVLKQFLPTVFVECHFTLDAVRAALTALGLSEIKTTMDPDSEDRGWILARAP